MDEVIVCALTQIVQFETGIDNALLLMLVPMKMVKKPGDTNHAIPVLESPHPFSVRCSSTSKELWRRFPDELLNLVEFGTPLGETFGQDANL